MSKRHTVTANSFTVNDSSVFHSGNFSAKYIRNNSNIGKTEASNSKTRDQAEEDAEELNQQPKPTRPVTISGGFQHTPSSEFNDSHQLGVSLSNNTFRRESLLSSSISQSLASSRKQKPQRADATIPLRKASDEKPEEEPEEEGHEEGTQETTVQSVEPAGTNYRSTKLQGGFITREIEPWVNDKRQSSFSHTGIQPLRRTNSLGSIKTQHTSNSTHGTEGLDSGVSVRELIAPGAFRRNFILNQHSNGNLASSNLVTKNFLEFLDLYGNFAGEDLREEESEYETEGEDEESRIDAVEELDNRRIPRTQQRDRKKVRGAGKKTSTKKAFLLLLKAFLGTGIIFLPKAFSNGGLLFSNVLIILFSFISYYCFVILIKTTSRCNVSGYGDVGLKILGKKVQFIILLSLVLSQLGFASTYVVFVSKNFKQLLEIIYSTEYSLGVFIAIQVLIFIPISWTRNISKLGVCALIADAFIFFGLIYIYCQSGLKFVRDGVSPKVELFKYDSWTLFIGTAVFTYEGIGLLIPIQESMREPEKFDKLLLLVMMIITLIFTSLSSLAYLSFGDDIHTIILMDFPMNSTTVTVQLLYSVAILLSTPIQLFPAIKIIESYLFNQKRNTWKDRIRRNSEAISIRSNGNVFSNTDATPLVPTLSSSYEAVELSTANLVNKDGLISGKSDAGVKMLKNLFRVSMVLLMCGVAYLGSDKLDKFVSLIGSVTCVPLIYIYPPLLYYYEFRTDLGLASRMLSVLLFTSGCMLMLYTSYETVSNW